MRVTKCSKRWRVDYYDLMVRKYCHYEKYVELDRPVRVRGRVCLVKTRGCGCATINTDDNW